MIRRTVVASVFMIVALLVPSFAGGAVPKDVPPSSATATFRGNSARTGVRW